MRKSIFFCSVGLLCVGWLTGCGLFRSLRDDCCGKKGNCVQASASAKAKDDSESKPSAYAKLTARMRPKAAPAKMDLKNAQSTPIDPPEMPPRILADTVKDSQEPIAAPNFPTAFETEEKGKKDRLIRKLFAAKPKLAASPIRSAANRTDEPPHGGLSGPVARVTNIEEVMKVSPNGEKNIAIKQVEITYGREPDFRSVTGQVQLYRKTWRLRYADVAQEDLFGGSLVLDGGAALSKLQSGQHIRVRGALVPPTDRNGTAHYRVETVEILD